MDKMKASLNAEVPADAPNVADVMAIVAPGQDKHRVLAMGSSRTFGLDAGKQETSYGLPYEPVNLGAGSVYKIFTTATAMAEGPGHQLPDDGAAVAATPRRSTSTATAGRSR